MRSFAIIAGLAASASAAAYGYPPKYNTTTPCETPGYKPTPAYPVYPAETPAYKPVEPYYTTKVYYGLTTYCPEPTTITYGYKTYTATCATTIIDNECTYTSTYKVTPTPCDEPVKPTTPCPEPVQPTKYPVAPSPAKPSYPAQFTGAAAQAGVALGAVAGALAAFL
jgi:hypothetical protein